MDAFFFLFFFFLDALCFCAATNNTRRYRLLAQHLRHAGSLERSLEQGLRAINLASNMHIDESVIAIACEALDTLDVLKDVHEHEELSFEMFITFVTFLRNPAVHPILPPPDCFGVAVWVGGW